MKIKSLRLQNIKSYLDETVSFYDGVNFISGINGAGKSTIIESIGLALFDFKPGKLDDFIRYGAKNGIITVDFEAKDGCLYRVVRKIGSTSSWNVFDGEKGTPLDDLHGNVDIKPWLLQCMDSEPDQNLGDLFQDIIGVRQGTFVAPFLDTETDRKNKFNKILKVEAYKEASDKTLKVVNVIRDNISDLREKRAGLEGQVADYDLVKSQIAEIKPRIAELASYITVKAQELEEKTKQRDGLRLKKNAKEQTEQAITIAKVELTNLQKQLENLTLDLEKAQKAQGSLKQNAGGYQTYLATKTVLDELEKQRTLRDSLSKELNILMQEINTIETALKVDGENIATQQVEQKTIQELKSKELALKEIAFSAAAIASQDVQGMKQTFANLQIQLKAVEKQLQELSGIRQRLEDGQEKWNLLRTTAEAIEKELSQEETIKQEVEALVNLESTRDALRLKLAGLNQKHLTLVANRKQSADGKCPFLDSPCQNIGGDLYTYFSSQISDCETALEKTKQEEIILEESIQVAQSSRKALQDFENDRIKLQGLKQDELGYVKAFKTHFATAAQIGDKIDFEEILVDSISLVSEFRTFTNTSAELIKDTIPGINELHSQAQDRFQSYKEMLKSIVTFSYVEITDITEDFEKLFANNVLMAEKLSAFFDTINRSILAEDTNRTAALGVVTTERAMLVQQLKDAEKKLTALEAKAQDLKSQGEECVKLQAAKEAKKIGLAIYKDLDDQIKAGKHTLDTNQLAYETYLRFREEAQKVEQISTQMGKTTADAKAKEVAISKLEAELSLLAIDFQENALVDLEVMVGNLQVEVATTRLSLEERNKSLVEYENRLKDMQKLKQEILSLDDKITKALTVKDTVEFIREIFKGAGTRVAGVFREFLGQEANRVYRDISKENVTLEWRDDYDVVLVDSLMGKPRERSFKQLSGGEQMTAALAVRLALLSQLSGAKIGFFDEPTTNLDSVRRSNLAQIIPAITGDFEQLFVISHDDAFDAITDNIIHLNKDGGEGTKLA